MVSNFHGDRESMKTRNHFGLSFFRDSLGLQVNNKQTMRHHAVIALNTPRFCVSSVASFRAS